MKNLFLLLLLAWSTCSACAQPPAERRNAALGLGANLSYLDNYWQGDPAKHFGDHVKFNEVLAKKPAFARMKALGFQHVRIPVCFSAWASLKAPYDWEFPQNLAAVDSFLVWARQAGLRAVLDFHHVEMNGSFDEPGALVRKQALWTRIATRYRSTDPDWVIFELQNEPNEITAAAWRVEAQALIATVRAIVPNHTLLIGFEEYNGRAALIRSEPFADPNLIYTFHFYDPFVFTHQGADWTGLGDVKNVRFPHDAPQSPAIPASVRGTWIEGALRDYPTQGQPGVLIRDLEAAKTWSDQKKVPVYLGEVGSFGNFADPASRCRHLSTILATCGVLGIPTAFWEWDQDFSLFAPNSAELLPCMAEALKSYTFGATGTEKPRTGAVRLSPNPTDGRFDLRSDTPLTRAEVLDSFGRVVLDVRETALHQLDLRALPAGVYAVRVFDVRQRAFFSGRILKR
jgi:endoglucanase